MNRMAQVRDASNSREEGSYAERFAEVVEDLEGLVHEAVRDGMSIYETEKRIFRQVLALGRQTLGWFLESSGNGDLGATLTLPNGDETRRLPVAHRRPYLSVFGSFEITRFVYGSREGQKIEHRPLDSRLDLPAGKYSYLLAEWSQLFAVDQAFAQAKANLETILGVCVPVDSLERICRHVSEPVVDYWDSLAPPPAQEEGELLVQTADFKGIPMQQGDGQRPKREQRGGLERPEGKKQMALLGGVYSIDRFQRTPEDVVEALFRDAKSTSPTDRPEPQHKRLRASLERDEKDSTEPALAEIYSWMALETAARNPDGGKPIICLTDGQPCLEEALGQYREHDSSATPIPILDLLHVTPRLWQAAKLLHPPDAPEITPFVRHRVTRILRGEVRAVVAGLRSLATRRKLPRKDRKKIERICRYLHRNGHRMRYDEYLQAGYPIATGVIEGACRHLVKDRLERSGMRWTPPTAQAMLDLRSIHSTGHWERFHAFRREQASQHLYPFRGSCDSAQLRLVA